VRATKRIPAKFQKLFLVREARPPQEEELAQAREEARDRPFSAAPVANRPPYTSPEQPPPRPKISRREEPQEKEKTTSATPQAEPPPRLENNRTIELDRFFPRAQLDSRYYHAPYYIAPRELVGQEAFAVIREAMAETAMADERIESRVRATGGEGIGKTADTKTQIDGLVYQATGAVKEAYGKTMDAAAESAETVKDAAVAGHDYLRKFMEDNPHTTTLIALGIGLVIGYATHRPPPRRNWWS
jgi:hypothetical protein